MDAGNRCETKCVERDERSAERWSGRKIKRAKSITIKLAILFEVDSRQRSNVVHPTADIGYYFENINNGDASSIVSA